MGKGHERLAATQRLRENLVPLVETWQRITPDCLIPRGYAALALSKTLTVTRQAASQHITRAIVAGDLLEVFPRPDWEVTLPGGEDLPTVYAHSEEGNRSIYSLKYDRPQQTRGAGQTSFVTTPAGLKEMLPLVRKQLGVPEPDPSIAGFYLPATELMIRPAMYQELLVTLIGAHPEKLTSSQASAVLVNLLRVLRLKAPTLPYQKRPSDG